MRHRFESFFIFLLGLGIIGYIVVLSGCKSVAPAIDAKFWAGDSAKGGISRSQDQKTIQCEEPEFDQFVCLSYEDLKKIYKTFLQCKQWGEPLMTSRQRKHFLKNNIEVIHHVTGKALESPQY